jgi:hypothetical protein
VHYQVATCRPGNKFRSPNAQAMHKTNILKASENLLGTSLSADVVGQMSRKESRKRFKWFLLVSVGGICRDAKISNIQNVRTTSASTTIEYYSTAYSTTLVDNLPTNLSLVAYHSLVL